MHVWRAACLKPPWPGSPHPVETTAATSVGLAVPPEGELGGPWEGLPLPPTALLWEPVWLERPPPIRSAWAGGSPWPSLQPSPGLSMPFRVSRRRKERFPRGHVGVARDTCLWLLDRVWRRKALHGLMDFLPPPMLWSMPCRVAQRQGSGVCVSRSQEEGPAECGMDSRVSLGCRFRRRACSARMGGGLQASGKGSLCTVADGERNLPWLPLHVRPLGFSLFGIDGAEFVWAPESSSSFKQWPWARILDVPSTGK